MQSFDVRPTVGSVQTQTHTHQKRAGLQCVDCGVYEDGNRATDVLFGTKETGDRQIKGSTALLHLSGHFTHFPHIVYTKPVCRTQQVQRKEVLGGCVRGGFRNLYKLL